MQFHNLLPFLGATDDVALVLQLAGVDRATARAGGAIPWALASSLRITLVDAPAAALDSKRAAIVMDLLRKLTVERDAVITAVTAFAVIATSEQQAVEFWHIRHSVSEANQREGVSVTHDVAVRSSAVAPFIAAADIVAAERYPQAKTLVVCHLGDGNVHYILLFQRDFWAELADPEAFALEVEREIHDVAARFGGTFSAEHDVGRKLTGELERLADPLRYELMTRVKALFDPQNLMNPGVLLGAARPAQTTAAPLRTEARA